MLEKELTERINELSRKSKAEGLTELEKKEQQKLRKEYVSRFRNSLKSHLDSIKIEKK